MSSCLISLKQGVIQDWEITFDVDISNWFFRSKISPENRDGQDKELSVEMLTNNSIKVTIDLSDAEEGRVYLWDFAYSMDNSYFEPIQETIRILIDRRIS